MADLPAIPYAPALIESMRSVGYSLESAIADLIDNSISANASCVAIQFRPFGDPYLAILDDGDGMAPDEITEAMRHGSRNPLEVRSESDLGRFGLGLKTASLSQCRKLTVVSMKSGVLSARCWDLDFVAETEQWLLRVPDSIEEIRRLPQVNELEAQSSGTLVLWQEMDRLAAGERSIESALGEKMDQVREHLALVFHRYLSREPGRQKFSITINNNPVEPVDPFLTFHRATQLLPEEDFLVENHTITVRPYILPHISKLSPDEIVLAGGEEGLRRNQGFYVYRNRRLIIWGTWFRLARQEELTKLARVRVDIPNALDHLWTLDIKKSGAYPPEVVRINLRRTVDRIAERSRRTYTYRGRRTNSNGILHTWSRIQGRDGVFYQINRDHPAIGSLLDTLDTGKRALLETVLRTLEATYPADALYADMASDRPQHPDDPSMESLRELAILMVDAIRTSNGDVTGLLQNLHLIEPFSTQPDFTAHIVKELNHVD
ncbi:MAG: ATP-binding protein [Rugosibacter sp.]|nr:MAG: ATP-binding protein [Rugosibacter sp.]TBR12133.1 MAG: ATP-binding protein [Rugosibacter sp.]